MFIQSRNFGIELVLRIGHVDGIHDSGDHLHQFCEFVFVRDGAIEITVDGQTTLAGPGDIAVITPFKIHSFKTIGHVVQLICVCSNAFFNDFLPFTEMCKRRTTSVFHASAPLWSYIIDSGFYDNVRTRREFDPVRDYNYIHKLKSLFYTVMAEYFDTVPVVGESTVDNTLSKILIYIYENYTSDLSLEVVGSALGYSPKYVSGCLSAISGLNFRQLINSLRIERAKALLINTDKNNIDVSFECGFLSQASFHRAFHDLVGVTPKQYRLKHRVR